MYLLKTLPLKSLQMETPSNTLLNARKAQTRTRERPLNLHQRSQTSFRQFKLLTHNSDLKDSCEHSKIFNSFDRFIPPRRSKQEHAWKDRSKNCILVKSTNPSCLFHKLYLKTENFWQWFLGKSPKWHVQFTEVFIGTKIRYSHVTTCQFGTICTFWLQITWDEARKKGEIKTRYRYSTEQRRKACQSCQEGSQLLQLSQSSQHFHSTLTCQADWR